MFREIEEQVLAEKPLSFRQAEELLNLEEQHCLELLALANRIRKHFQGNGVDLCAIINGKSGKCSENCAFCAQSAYHGVGIDTYDLLDKESILSRAKMLERAGSHRFAIVTSGRGIKAGKELDKLVDIFADLAKETSLGLCASLGIIDYSVAQRLKETGLQRYHHNVETASGFFSNICSTHTYAERIATIKVVQDVGLSVCSGGILGLGESKKQRVEMAWEIKNLAVDSVPLNFLNPIRGTPLEKQGVLNPWEALKTVAVFRLLMPKTNLRFCGGREVVLRDLQGLGMLAGANGLMLGNYLTTGGRKIEDDLEMLKDLGFSY